MNRKLAELLMAKMAEIAVRQNKKKTFYYLSSEVFKVKEAGGLCCISKYRKVNLKNLNPRSEDIRWYRGNERELRHDKVRAILSNLSEQELSQYLERVEEKIQELTPRRKSPSPETLAKRRQTLQIKKLEKEIEELRNVLLQSVGSEALLAFEENYGLHGNGVEGSPR